MTKPSPQIFALCGAAIFLSACGGGGDDDPSNAADFPPHDNTEEVEAFYKAHPERFIFKTIEDLPEDLVWENGMDLPDIGSPDAKKGGTTYIAQPDFPRTLRTSGPDSIGGIRRLLLDETAMTYAPRHPNVEGYYPGLAKEWAIVPDTATVYVRINPEARWSDGHPITTEDSLFSWYFYFSEHTGAPFSKHFMETKLKSITVFDDHTYAVTVAEKKPDFASYVLEVAPKPRHFYTEHGPDFAMRYNWRFAPTTAAYIIKPEDIKKGRSIAFTRNDDWWAKDLKFWRNRYNPDRIQLTVIRDPDKTFEAFKKGDLDTARLGQTKYWYEQLPDDDPLVQNGYIHKIVFYNDVPRGSRGLWLNMNRPPLDNVHVRRGIHHACNWDLVIQKFFRGDWDRLTIASEGYGDVSHPSITPREFSVEKAREEFAKAGFTKRGADGILVNEQGDRLSFTLSTGYKTFADALVILKQEAQKAGVEFNLEIMEFTAAHKKDSEKKHEITFTGYSPGTNAMYPRFWDYWHTDSAFEEDGSIKTNTPNLTSTSIPELDPMIKAYDQAESHEEKVELAHQIEEILYDHAAWVPGADMRFYRTGYWRWVKWPEDFNVKRSELARSTWVHWIDEDARKETKEAMKSGKTFESVIKVYDQYKVD
ncbi:MAG: extracellular solute-binding protein [Verrucomicrobiota bacterium]